MSSTLANEVAAHIANLIAHTGNGDGASLALAKAHAPGNGIIAP